MSLSDEELALRTFEFITDLQHDGVPIYGVAEALVGNALGIFIHGGMTLDEVLDFVTKTYKGIQSIVVRRGDELKTMTLKQTMAAGRAEVEVMNERGKPS